MVTASPTQPPAIGRALISVRGLTVGFRDQEVLRDIDLEVPDQSALALLGPSRCGKSTLLRALNRMHELRPGAFVRGEATLAGDPIYGPSSDPTEVRRRIGLVRHLPTPFPGLNIYDNIAAGLRMQGGFSTDIIRERVEEALHLTELWDEVANRLDTRADRLPRGHQQRLCIARALAVRPDVLMLDEPSATLDPVETALIEDLVHALRKTMAVIFVTHNPQQAARVSDITAVMLDGQIVETAPTDDLFTAPKSVRTENYITGRSQ